MPIEVEDGPWEQAEDDLATVMRFQSILLSAVEGTRDDDIDREYQAFRKAILAEPQYRSLLPTFVKSNRDLKSLWPFFKSYDGSWEPRRKMVREELMSLIDKAEENTFPPINKNGADSSLWTGIETSRQRLLAIRTLAPVAQASIETLIATLETPNHNGGPQLDDHADAIKNLRELHKKLGELLSLEDDGVLSGTLGIGILSEVAGYAKRAARDLRNDPLPYALSAMLLAMLTAIGAPGIAGYMAGVALNIRKNKPQ